MTTNWRVYGEDTVAARLSRAEISGLLRKQITVGPKEAAVVIDQGRIEHVITAERMQVSGFWDGVRSWGWVEALAGPAPQIEVVFVNLSPIEIPVFLGGHNQGGAEYVSDQEHAAETGVMLAVLSRDREVITGECRVRVAVGIEEAGQVAGWLKGRNAISVWDLAATIRTQVFRPVVVPLIARHESEEFRASSGIRKAIDTEVRLRVKPALAGMGLQFLELSIVWGLTEAEAREIALNRERRKQAAIEFAYRRRLAEMQREQQIERTKITHLQELAVAQAQGDEELKTLLLAGEVQRELAMEGKRIDLTKIEVRVRELQLDLEQREHAIQCEQHRQNELLRLDLDERRYKQQQAARLAEIEVDDRELSQKARRAIQVADAAHHREMAKRRAEIEAAFCSQQTQLEHQHKQLRIGIEADRSRMGMLERILSRAIDKGVIDASALKTLIEGFFMGERMSQAGVQPHGEQELEYDSSETGLSLVQSILAQRIPGRRPALERVRPAIAPIRADRLILRVSTAEVSHTWFVIAADKIRAGRQHLDEGGRRVNDVILRLMPRTTEHQRRTLEIGRRQFVCEREGNGFTIQQIANTPLLVDGTPSGLRRPRRLDGEGKIEIGGALALVYRLSPPANELSRSWRNASLQGAAKAPGAVVFQRLDNADNVGYVMLCGALRLGLSGSLVPANDEPLAGWLCCGKALRGATGCRWLFLQEAGMSVNGSPTRPGCIHELGTELVLRTETAEFTVSEYDYAAMKDLS